MRLQTLTCSERILTREESRSRALARPETSCPRTRPWRRRGMPTVYPCPFFVGRVSRERFGGASERSLGCQMFCCRSPSFQSALQEGDVGTVRSGGRMDGTAFQPGGRWRFLRSDIPALTMYSAAPEDPLRSSGLYDRMYRLPFFKYARSEAGRWRRRRWCDAAVVPTAR